MPTQLEPEKLNPEVKWRTMIGIFLNYLSTADRVLKAEVDDKAHKKIIEKIGVDYWREQAQAFINIFNLKPSNAIEVSFLERILAALLDIKLKILTESSEEVLMECEYKFCPIRIALRPTLGDYCNYCGLLLHYMASQFDPSFKSEMIKTKDGFQHRISRSK